MPWKTASYDGTVRSASSARINFGLTARLKDLFKRAGTASQAGEWKKAELPDRLYRFANELAHDASGE